MLWIKRKRNQYLHYSLEKTCLQQLYRLKISTNLTITLYQFENLCVVRRTLMNRFPTQNSTRTYLLDHTYYRLRFCPIKSSQPRNFPFPSMRTLLQLGNSSFPPSCLSPPIRIAAKVYRWRLATVSRRERWTTLAKEIFTWNGRKREARARVDRITHSSEAWRARIHGRRERESGKERFQYGGRVMRPVTESYLTCGYDGLPTRLLLWNS